MSIKCFTFDFWDLAPKSLRIQLLLSMSPLNNLIISFSWISYKFENIWVNFTACTSYFPSKYLSYDYYIIYLSIAIYNGDIMVLIVINRDSKKPFPNPLKYCIMYWNKNDCVLLEMAEYMQYVRHLEFYEEPNYRFLQHIFSNALHKNGFEDDQMFDWINK